MEDQKDISKQGYKDSSPYKDKPYIDIHTPDGIIDMNDVSIPLLANNVILQPNSGLHKFDTTIVREIPLAKYGGSVKQSPYNKEKLALKNQDGIIADMMHNGAFLPKFEMGAEKNIETPKGNYTIKKDFDKSRGLPYINYSHKDIEDRVYYDKDDEDDSGNFQIIDIAQQIYDQKRAHELTKALIKRYKSGEELSYSAMMHLSSLGVIPKDKIKDPKIETLKKAPPAPQEIRFEDLNVSSNIKNVTLGDDKIIPIDDQIALYMAHISGISKGTPYEKKLKRIYDKLNRVYYKDSKNAGLDVIEYMKSLTES